MSTLLEFTVASMIALAPGRDHTVLSHALSEVLETEAPLFRDDPDKLRTAALMIAISFREGTLKESVVGDCDNSKPGVCKGKPHSFCTMQIHDSSGGSEWLNENPYQCFQKGLALLRVSMKVCPAYPLAQYASGPNGCSNERAQRISKDRMNLAHWLWMNRKKNIDTN